ncbi:MAG: prephenate dehydratase [Magnetococcales bacterium]|nr:prephenate dehydratase [Magnetococcales bacterium]MBF0322121.1 prephenate dehydratase [Magnetococcales bacterium]
MIAFQGKRGAYSEQACREKLPGRDLLPCYSFEDVFLAVEDGKAAIGMLPVENSMAGVVSDSYDLLATHKLHIVGEHYLLVRHSLLGLPDAHLDGVKAVYSHPQGLAQCRAFLKRYNWVRFSVYDTAGAAADLVERGNPADVAVASELCADLYGLKVLKRDIQDCRMNTTRFLLVARDEVAPPDDLPCKTSLLFAVRNIPAALYKCLGGFATNGVNLTRLESRPIQGMPWAYHFYLDFQGRPNDVSVRHALDELKFFTNSIKYLGCYPESDKPEPPEGDQAA